MGRLTSWRWAMADAVPQQRPPSMELHLGASVPAWLVRIVAFVLAVSAGLMVVSAGPTTVLMVLACLSVLCWPGFGLPVVVAALIGWGLLAGEPSEWESSVVVLGVHAFLVLTRLVGGVGWEARVELRALARVGGPFVVMQVLAQVMMHLALAVPAGDASMVWVAIAGLAALVALTALLVRALRRVG